MRKLTMNDEAVINDEERVRKRIAEFLRRSRSHARAIERLWRPSHQAGELVARNEAAILAPRVTPMKNTAQTINELIESIRSGQPPELPEGIREKHYRDPALPNFYIRLLNTGVASWVLQWKQLGRQKKVTLGNVLVRDRLAAIKAAKELLAKITLGTLDPHEARRERMRADKVKFAVVAGLYLKKRKTDLRPNTYNQWEPYFTGYYFQPLHNLPMDEITREQIQTQIDQVVIQSGPRAAQHCWVVIRLLFKWALKTDKLPKGHPNPTTDLEEPKTNPPRKRVLTDDEIRLIWKTCEDWEAEAVHYENMKAASADGFWQRRERNSAKKFQPASAISRGLLRDKLPKLEAELRNNPAIGNRPLARKLGLHIDTVRRVRKRMGIAPATWLGTSPCVDFPRGIMLLFLTGCRSHEISDLKRSEVDLDNGEILIPGTRTKNHEELCNPLSDWAVEILRRCKQRPGKDEMFEHQGLRKKANRAIKKRIAKAGASLPQWGLHDIRRTFRTRMAALGVGTEVGEALVNHTGHRTEVEEIYNRYKYWPEKRQALAMWEANLRAIIDGTAEKIAHPRFGEPKKGGDPA